MAFSASAEKLWEFLPKYSKPKNQMSHESGWLDDNLSIRSRKTSLMGNVENRVRWSKHKCETETIFRRRILDSHPTGR